MYVRDWMARRSELAPNKPAVVDFASGEVLTYKHLDERATRLANHLRERAGVRSGDRIAILATNRTEVLEAFFAAAKLTAVLVPLNYRLAAPELRYILEDCEPAVMLYERAFEATVDRLRGAGAPAACIALEPGGEDPDYESALAESHAEPVDVDVFDPEMIALIIYTSGTTGRPKGAMLSHRMLTWNSINTNMAWDLVSSDVTTVHSPLFHTGGFNVLTLPLLHLGGTVVMLERFDAADLLAAIEQYRCTVVFGVPTMFQMMVESPRFASADLASVRFFITGGAPCPLGLIDVFDRRGVPLTQGFGLTEVGPNCFRLGVEDAVRKAGSIGRPNFHSEARLVDELGRDVARGAVGELLLRGLHVCSGYWQNAEATAAAFGDGWFYTGDLARQDDEGYYYVVGRAKDMIISGGENIYPAEVEAVLHEHPAIASAALVGVADATWGETPVAAVVVRPGRSVTGEEVIDFCSGRLARYKTPKHVLIVDELPLLGSGKVAKGVLKTEVERALRVGSAEG